jgi:hypothetical protein
MELAMEISANSSNDNFGGGGVDAMVVRSGMVMSFPALDRNLFCEAMDLLPTNFTFG